MEYSRVSWNAIPDNNFAKIISLKDIFKHQFVGLNLFFFKQLSLFLQITENFSLNIILQLGQNKLLITVSPIIDRVIVPAVLVVFGLSVRLNEKLLCAGFRSRTKKKTTHITKTFSLSLNL